MNASESWQFVTDDKWSDDATAERMYELSDRMAAMAAGNASLKFFDKYDRLIGMESLSMCGPVEVAVRFDALDENAVWAWRDRPCRCEACGLRVDEDDDQTDSEGVVLCDSCCESL